MRTNSRVRNEASVEDVKKLLRANVSKLTEADYMTTEVEDVVRNYSGFILDLLKATPRVNKNLLKAACGNVFSTSKDVSECFAGAIVRAITFCKDKVRSSTSGKKLHPAVFSIVKFLKNDEEPIIRRGTSSQSISLSSSSKRKISSSPVRDSKCVSEVLALDTPSPTRFKGSFLDRTKQMLALSPKSSSRASIFALYGQDVSKTATRSTAQSSTDVQLLDSESETDKLPEAKATFVQFLDSANMALKRRMADDSEIVATMRPGGAGFMEGFFGEDGPHSTDIPNAIFAAAVAKGGIPVMSAAWRQDILDQVNANKQTPRGKGKATGKAKAKAKAKVRAKPAAATVSEKEACDQEDESDSDSHAPTELYDDTGKAFFLQYGLSSPPPTIQRREPVELKEVQLKLVCASDKTYILHKPKKADKFVLMVNCTKAMADTSNKHHNAVIVVGVWDRFVKDKCVPTKDKAVEFRDFFLTA